MSAADTAHEKLSNLYVDMVKTNEHDFKESAVFVFKNYVVFYFNSFVKNSNDIDVLYMATDFNGYLLEFYVQSKANERGIAGWVCNRTAKEAGLLNMSDLQCIWFRCRLGLPYYVCLSNMQRWKQRWF